MQSPSNHQFSELTSIHTFFNFRVYLYFSASNFSCASDTVPLECRALGETGGPIHHVQPFGPSHCKRKQTARFKRRKLSKADVFLTREPETCTLLPTLTIRKLQGTTETHPRAPIAPLLQHLPLQGSARPRTGSIHSLCTACSFSHAQMQFPKVHVHHSPKRPKGTFKHTLKPTNVFPSSSVTLPIKTQIYNRR